MNRFSCFFVTILFFALTLLFGLQLIHAQEYSLTKEQQREYKRNRMSIELVGKGVGFHNYKLGMSSYTTWRKWHAFEGFRRISEAEFFRKCGYYNEARNASDYRKKYSTMKSIGLLGGLGGLAIFVIAYSENNLGLGSVGALVSGIGLGLAIRAARHENINWAPYSTVRGIAEEYNTELRLQIQRNF